MSEKAVHIALYPSDWLAGTRGLTPAETGVYITLVCMMYERQGPLPFDHARLARMCNCPAGTFKKILAILIDERKLIETPEGIWQSRVEKEIEAAKMAMQDASERAKRAAEARWKKPEQQSDHCEIATVKPQSDKQQGEVHSPKKPNKNSNGDMQEQCPSNANQSQNQSQKLEDDDDDTHARDSGFFEEVCRSAGRDLGALNGNGTRFGMSPKEADAVKRWQVELNLSQETILQDVRHQSARMRSPPNSLTYFTPGLQQLAAELTAPPITPEQSHVQVIPPKSGGYRQSRSSAADDAFVRRIHAAARARSPS